MIEPGDVVECVKPLGIACPNCGAAHNPKSGDAIPRVGAHYRVLDTMDGKARCCNWVVPGLQPVSPSLGTCCWPQFAFRKLEKASEDIFRLAKAPREKEPA